MSKEKILVIDDEADILELISYNLGREGYRTICVGSGGEGLDKAEGEQPHLIILDLMLPDLDGLDVCRRLRKNPKTQHIPIIMLTAKGEEADIVASLELGADDYMVKPFSPRVLIARIHNVLRRVSEKPGDETASISVHELVIHPGRHEVLVRGKKADLTLTEFRLLHFLVRRPGWVFTRYQIVDAVNRRLYDHVRELVERGEATFGHGVQLVRIFRQFERIADMVTNIAEDVIYMCKGEIVRHYKKE